MLRNFLTLLSCSLLLKRISARFGPARRLARRFIAGEELEDAILVASALNDKGMAVTLNHLGEHVETRNDARRAVRDYIRLMHRIREHGIVASVSIKPSHLGLAFGKSFLLETSEAVVREGAALETAMEIDMEDSGTTEDTLWVYRSLQQRYGRLRQALQASLYRTGDDLKEIASRGGSVRLVKGAYDESAQVAWRNKQDVDAGYSRLIAASFSPEARADRFYPAFGTHDHGLIDEVIRTARKRGASPAEYEFQMLLGVRRDLQEKLVHDGFKVRIYVPFGNQWYPYFMRRLAEKPANLLFMARAILGS